VPLTSFSEFDHGAKQDVWSALSPDRPLPVFAGIWTPQ
jgi:putative SOS response-associated peptidase YedK